MKQQPEMIVDVVLIVCIVGFFVALYGGEAVGLAVGLVVVVSLLLLVVVAIAFIIRMIAEDEEK